MNKPKLLAFVLCAGLLLGCSQNPPSLMEVQPHQRTLSAAKNWRALSDRTIEAMFCERPSGGDAPRVCRHDRPVYVASAAPDMPFSAAFRLYLLSGLLQRGVPISKTPVNADVLTFHLQAFLSDRSTGSRHPFDQYTFWTTLGALGWAAYEIGVSTGAGIVSLAAAGPALDFLEGRRHATDAEVVISASLERAQGLPKFHIEEFYVQPRDVVPGGLYWSNFPPGPFDQQPLHIGPPPPVQIIRVSGN